MGGRGRLFSKFPGPAIVLRWRNIYAGIRALGVARAGRNGRHHFRLQLWPDWSGAKQPHRAVAGADRDYPLRAIRRELHLDPADLRGRPAFHRRSTVEISIPLSNVATLLGGRSDRSLEFQY